VSKVLCYRPEKVYTYLAEQVSSFFSGNCTSARSRARNPAVRVFHSSRKLHHSCEQMESHRMKIIRIG